MTSPNDKTIGVYDKEASAYISKTPPTHQHYHKSMLTWIDMALAHLSGDKVLEVGSATLRDAAYIRSKGFIVTTSDASTEFVRLLREQGEKPLLLNVLSDPIPTGYNLIFANAVAPHFTASDLSRFLKKAHGILPPHGRIAFNLKAGTGEEWVNEKLTARRFIHYWQPDDVKHFLLTQNMFKIIFFETNAKGDLPTHHWINIVVEKAE